MSKLLADIIVVVVLTFPVWLTGIMVILQNNRGSIVESNRNWRLKEGEKVLSRGTKYVVAEPQYRKQRRLLFMWWIVKWYSISNYEWMKKNSFKVI